MVQLHYFQLSLRRAALCLGVTAALSACVPASGQFAKSASNLERTECSQSSDALCFFRNAPLRLDPQPVRLPGRPYDFFPTAEQLDFIDNSRSQWTAPVRTLTDGASIPPAFVSLVGEPRSPEFALAAAIHDAYCGVGNEGLPTYRGKAWQDVHRMFYDALVIGGTPDLKAKLMFAAVWLGGPRWHPISKADDRRLGRAPAAAKFAAMAATKSYIEKNKPSMQQLMLFLQQREAMLLKQAGFAGERDSTEDDDRIISPGNGDGFTSP